MKLFVLVNQAGMVVATAACPADASNSMRFAPTPLDGQTLHEIEITDEDANLAPEELHAKIKSDYLR